MSMFLSLHIAASGPVPKVSHDVKIGVDFGTTCFTACVWEGKTYVNPESAYEILSTDNGKRHFPY